MQTLKTAQNTRNVAIYVGLPSDSWRDSLACSAKWQNLDVCMMIKLSEWNLSHEGYSTELVKVVASCYHKQPVTLAKFGSSRNVGCKSLVHVSEAKPASHEKNM